MSYIFILFHVFFCEPQSKKRREGEAEATPFTARRHSAAAAGPLPPPAPPPAPPTARWNVRPTVAPSGGRPRNSTAAAATRRPATHTHTHTHTKKKRPTFHRVFLARLRRSAFFGRRRRRRRERPASRYFSFFVLGFFWRGVCVCVCVALPMAARPTRSSREIHTHTHRHTHRQRTRERERERGASAAGRTRCKRDQSFGIHQWHPHGKVAVRTPTTSRPASVAEVDVDGHDVVGQGHVADRFRRNSPQRRRRRRSAPTQWRPRSSPAEAEQSTKKGKKNPTNRSWAPRLDGGVGVAAGVGSVGVCGFFFLRFVSRCLCRWLAGEHRLPTCKWHVPTGQWSTASRISRDCGGRPRRQAAPCHQRRTEMAAAAAAAAAATAVAALVLTLTAPAQPRQRRERRVGRRQRRQRRRRRRERGSRAQVWAVRHWTAAPGCVSTAATHTHTHTHTHTGTAAATHWPGHTHTHTGTHTPTRTRTRRRLKRRTEAKLGAARAGVSVTGPQRKTLGGDGVWQTTRPLAGLSVARPLTGRLALHHSHVSPRRPAETNKAPSGRAPATAEAHDAARRCWCSSTPHSLAAAHGPASASRRHTAAAAAAAGNRFGTASAPPAGPSIRRRPALLRLARCRRRPARRLRPRPSLIGRRRHPTVFLPFGYCAAIVGRAAAGRRAAFRRLFVDPFFRVLFFAARWLSLSLSRCAVGAACAQRPAEPAQPLPPSHTFRAVAAVAVVAGADPPFWPCPQPALWSQPYRVFCATHSNACERRLDTSTSTVDHENGDAPLGAGELNRKRRRRRRRHRAERASRNVSRSTKRRSLRSASSHQITITQSVCK